MFHILTAMLVTWLYLFITVQQKRWFLLDVNYISIKRKKIHPMYWKIQKAERLGNLSLGLVTQWKVANQPWLVCCRLYLPSHSSDPVWSHTPKQAKPGSWKNQDPIFFFFFKILSYLHLGNRKRACLGALWWPRGLGWGFRGEVQEGGDICILLADSHSCTAETSTIL